MLTKVHLVKAMVFLVVMYGCERWTIKKAEHKRRCFWTSIWSLWRRLLRFPWTARRSKQSILKEIRPEYSLEGLMLKLKLQYLGHLMWRTDSLERLWCWERFKAGGEGDDRGWDGWMAHRLDGHEFELAPGVGDRQESLVCCSPWGCKESDTTEQLKWTDKQFFNFSCVSGTEEPGGLPSMELHRVGHGWSNLAAAAAVFLWTP